MGCFKARIIRSTFNDAQRGVHEEQDIRDRVHSAMEGHICADAFYDSGARHEISRCHPNTRRATLETISDWIADPASHCLWLNGPAGAGKSAIAYTVAEQCRLDKTLGATYFFTKGSTGGPAQWPPPLFSTLVYQLMSVFPGLDEHLWAVIRADRKIFKRSLSFQLDRLIVQPFLKLASTSQPASAVVIVDGLDECDHGDAIQGEIVRLLLGLEQHTFPLLFLISSRSEPVIRRAFESSLCSRLTRLPLHRSLDSDGDIRRFLCKEFKQLCVEMGILSLSSDSGLELPWPSTYDIEELVRKSSGYFIYAATVIKFVQEDHAYPMDQLDAILQIPSRSTSSSAVKGVIADSIAFQELDGLYLHILHKYRKRAELARILHTIMHLNRYALAENIERIFNLSPGSVPIMLGGLHSIIGIPKHGSLRFLHASFSDFLSDPERSHEFHLEASRFNAELACRYMRIIIAFSPAKSGDILGIAMHRLGGCLKATAGLLSETLVKLIDIVTQGSESLPCLLYYIILDFLLSVFKELPGAEDECKHCEGILQQLEPRLVELSDEISTILGVLDALSYAADFELNLPMETLHPSKIDQLTRFPPNGEEIFKQTLNFNHQDLIVQAQPEFPVYTSTVQRLDAPMQPFNQMRASLERWRRARSCMPGTFQYCIRERLMSMY